VKAIEAYRLPNDYVGDLVAGTRSLALFEISPLLANASTNRMALRSLTVQREIGCSS
jgi:hypothetical protein